MHAGLLAGFYAFSQRKERLAREEREAAVATAVEQARREAQEKAAAAAEKAKKDQERAVQAAVKKALAERQEESGS